MLRHANSLLGTTLQDTKGSLNRFGRIFEQPDAPTAKRVVLDSSTFAKMISRSIASHFLVSSLAQSRSNGVWPACRCKVTQFYNSSDVFEMKSQCSMGSSCSSSPRTLWAYIISILSELFALCSIENLSTNFQSHRLAEEGSSREMQCDVWRLPKLLKSLFLLI